MWSSEKVRQTFFEYFESKGHSYVKSGPCVPKNDPSLLFVNAGMNQFKPIFLGQKIPNSIKVYNSQKCIRAGGKHNDLDDVGKDVYHHTFFEMLGNWSFGSYFKQEAIDMAWDLLINVYKLEPDRLYVTYYSDDSGSDIESKNIWTSIMQKYNLDPKTRVLPFDSKDNFWEMGTTGPCGPCTEIHYDRIGSRDASSLVNKDDPDVLEIWNIVFMQYFRDDKLHSLPNKHVDTGMGFERLVSVLQNKRSNYDTDIFTPLIEKISEMSSKEYGESNKIDIAFRILADHIRTLSFAISDGCDPSNKGSGYVLRRILRRAIRYSRDVLEINENISELVPILVKTMGNIYPELLEKQKHIVEILDKEEIQFLKSLKNGKRQLRKVISKMKKDGVEIVSGDVVFNLYSTHGFPSDLTEIIVKEDYGLSVDLKRYHERMRLEKDISKG